MINAKLILGLLDPRQFPICCLSRSTFVPDWKDCHRDWCLVVVSGEEKWVLLHVWDTTLLAPHDIHLLTHRSKTHRYKLQNDIITHIIRNFFNLPSCMRGWVSSSIAVGRSWWFVRNTSPIKSRILGSSVSELGMRSSFICSSRYRPTMKMRW